MASDSRILNVMLQNKDAHMLNIGQGSHWVNGRTHPVFIDFGASLRHGTNVSMTNFDVWGNSAPVNRVRRHTYDTMKRMSYDDLKPAVNDGLISKDEAKKILGIRDGIVRYFDDLWRRAEAEGKPTSAVFID